ncbi:MAG: hypothetical protein KGL95_05935 [Patescibacteria group bacterium]|nr:hypothetical protein [Patescibacteria group bacterium]
MQEQKSQETVQTYCYLHCFYSKLYWITESGRKTFAVSSAALTANPSQNIPPGSVQRYDAFNP